MNTKHLIPIDLIEAKQSIEDICIMGAICKDSDGKEVLSSLNNYLQKILSSIKETHFKKTENISDERIKIESIAEEFRINEGFTEDVNICYVSGFDKGANWQKEQDKVTIDKLTETLNDMCNKAEKLSLWDKMDTSYYKAKELLNSLK